jgi:hypothetical protein
MRSIATALILFLGLTTVAAATPPIEKRAKEAGFPATDCQYCHSFDQKHMADKAKAMGISPLNCQACHAARLPKSGTDLFNDRGKWLVAEKTRRNAKDVDVNWLKDYVPPSPQTHGAHAAGH